MTEDDDGYICTDCEHPVDEHDAIGCHALDIPSIGHINDCSCPRRYYTVNVTLDGDWWMVQIPELDATNDTTQARTATEVEDMAASLISTVTGAAPADITLRVNWNS